MEVADWVTLGQCIEENKNTVDQTHVPKDYLCWTSLITICHMAPFIAAKPFESTKLTRVSLTG